MIRAAGSSVEALGKDSSPSEFPNSAAPVRALVVTNMYPTPERKASGVFIEQQVAGLRLAGVEVDVLVIDRSGRGMQVYFQMDGPVRERLESFRPDLIHVMYGGIMAQRIVDKPWGVPVVVTFHGSDLLGENLSGYWRKLISHYGIHCSQRAARKADGIVTVSRLLRDELPEDVDRAKVRIIPCGIDLNRFKPMDPVECRSQLGWPEGVVHILFPSSSGDPVKQPDLALAAVTRLQQFGVPAQIHFMSGIPNDQVPAWFNASNCLLLTSLHEGSPTVVKEALACNVPVVSVNVGDVADRIEGIDGCYLAESNPRDLAQKLRLLQPQTIRVAGRQRVQELAHTAIAERLKEFYQQLVRASVHPKRASSVAVRSAQPKEDALRGI